LCAAELAGTGTPGETFPPEELCEEFNEQFGEDFSDEVPPISPGAIGATGPEELISPQGVGAASKISVN
jgi:hypothetical protein